MIAGSEPIANVLKRAIEGVPVTQGLGPFYVVLTLSASSRRLACPIEFESVEAALLNVVKSLPQLEACLEDGFQLTICKRLGSTLVH
jgi:hypothetical protein